MCTSSWISFWYFEQFFFLFFSRFVLAFFFTWPNSSVNICKCKMTRYHSFNFIYCFQSIHHLHLSSKYILIVTGMDICLQARHKILRKFHSLQIILNSLLLRYFYRNISVKINDSNQHMTTLFHILFFFLFLFFSIWRFFGQNVNW